MKVNYDDVVDEVCLITRLSKRELMHGKRGRDANGRERLVHRLLDDDWSEREVQDATGWSQQRVNYLKNRKWKNK